MGWGKKGKDPFDDLRLDEDFVREAPAVEMSAEQRAARQRREAFLLQMDEAIAEEADAALRSRRRTWRRRVPAVILIVALVSLFGLRYVIGSGGAPAFDPSADLTHGPDRFVYESTVVELPPVGVEAADQPLGKPAPLEVVSDRYAFIQPQPGSQRPVAYDPCRPVHVVVNNRHAPAGSDDILQEALAEVSKATGLRFIVDGPTDEAPDRKRLPHQPDRYPGRWAPVLIAWSNPAESPELARPVLGTGGSFAIPVDHQVVYVTGQVVLHGPRLNDILDKRDGRKAVRAVIMHELGHVVGLDHVTDPSQVMSESGSRGRNTFGAGDLTGLHALGQGNCYPSI